MRRRYTSKQLEFLRAGYLEMKVPELTVAFNKKFKGSRTEVQIKSALSNHKFRCGRPRGNPKGTYLAYTNEQAQYLIDHYPKMQLEPLVVAFNKKFKTNKTIQQIRAFTRNHKVKSGRTGQFEKGHEPFNKGMKGYEAGGRSAETRFKKGKRPRNWMPIGSERLMDGYLQRKMTDTGYPPRDWIGVHILLWEEHHGPIPKNHVVIFIDGDKTNIRLDNLELLSRAEVLYLNRHGWKETAPELRPSMLALARLETKRFKLSNPE